MTTILGAVFIYACAMPIVDYLWQTAQNFKEYRQEKKSYRDKIG